MAINYKDYNPGFKKISKYIREVRSGNKCEWCGVENKAVGYRGNNDGKWYSLQEVEDALDKRGYDYFEYELAHYLKKDGTLKRQPTKIVLTVAHYDQTKTNDRFVKDPAYIWDLKINNLFALCQRCHLKHDMNQHVANRKRNKKIKSKQLSFLEGV